MFSITTEEILSFLTQITLNTKQTTKRNRYIVLSSFFNFTISTNLPKLNNPCNSPILRKIFKRPSPIQWKIIEKDLVDEIIFRTIHTRNRILLELMARGGMRVGEVLNLTPSDVDDRRLILQKPKSGRQGEVVYIPRKLNKRLFDYIREEDIQPKEYIFPITYSTAWHIVKNSGKMVGINLRPHDLRRHAATHASRAGTPLEIVSKVILRHADLTTTQRYLGKINDREAIRWIENLYG
ncbi:site-specific integrase [Oceanicoccus sp.]|uniref:tyrosine-type recombinase/integrase n=1 Tax=Oceanicoccus sp. TaxID=2691044 RepID=UPI002623EB23|nr:site-specific integrase [Oceanicoccus sp.]